jgi:hypothetical protein
MGIPFRFTRFWFGAIVAWAMFSFFLIYQRLNFPQWLPFPKPDLGFSETVILSMSFLLIQTYLLYRHSQLVSPVPLSLNQILKTVLWGLAAIPVMLVMLVVIFALVL